MTCLKAGREGSRSLGVGRGVPLEKQEQSGNTVALSSSHSAGHGEAVLMT